MTLKQLVEFASRKSNFGTIDDYIDFARRYLEFAAEDLQAVIVSQNETHYCFYQYKQDGHFNITRPINTRLMYDVNQSRLLSVKFSKILKNARDLPARDDASRTVIRNSIYTIQQCIGAALDALPAGKSNTARKINGDLFERLIRLLILRVGVDCTTGSIRVPVIVGNQEQFQMNYQHDLITTGSSIH